MMGVYKKPTELGRKIIEYARAHPNSSMADIGRGVGCHPSYVWHVDKMFDAGLNITRHVKLSEEEMSGVRKKWMNGWKCREIAEYYDVSDPTVRKICRGMEGQKHHWTIDEDIMLAEMVIDGYKSVDIAKRLSVVSERQVSSRRQRLRYLYKCGWEEMYKMLVMKKIEMLHRQHP